MRGYIRHRGKRGAGSYEITIDLGVDPVTGKRQRRFLHVRGRRGEAEAVLAAQLHALATGTDVDPSKETVAGYLERWLRDYARNSVAPRTYDRYEQIIRQHVIPALGSLRLTQLRPAHIVSAERAWLEGGRKRGTGGLSPRTVLHHHRVLHEALRQAVRWQLLAVNPTDAVTPPRGERTEMRALDARQCAALLDALRGTEHEVAITTAVHGGLRISELLALRWRDVDLAHGRLGVQQALHPRRGGGFTFGPTKTHRSRRPVSLPGEVVDLLHEHRTRQLQRRLLAGPAWQDDLDLVFCDALGGPVSPGRLRNAFYRALDAAGLPRIRVHDYADLLIMPTSSRSSCPAGVIGLNLSA